MLSKSRRIEHKLTLIENLSLKKVLSTMLFKQMLHIVPICELQLYQNLPENEGVNIQFDNSIFFKSISCAMYPLKNQTLK